MNPGQVRIRCYSEGPSDLALLPELTRRLLGDKPYVRADGWELSRFHKARGFAHKATSAIREARRRGYAGAVIVVDRDKPRYACKLTDLQLGREQAEHEGRPIPTALGLAIEEIEAWLLPDDAPGPEGIPDPKKWLKDHLDTDSVEYMTKRTREVDLERLAKRCPKGFAPFRQEVKTRLGGLVHRN